MPLAPQLADYAGVAAGQRVLDVGSGPGALTTELVARLGADAVSAVDPSEPFVAAAKERHPGVDVQRSAAEQLPFDDRAFDAALAQLVVHFMADPVAGLREMARVTRERGVVAACVWDHGGGQGPLSTFWEAARELDPEAQDESKLAGSGEGQLTELFRQPGCTTSRRRRFRSASSIRASRTGGSRTRSAWGLRAATQPVSTRSGRRSCANGAARSCPTHRSCSRPAPGPPEASPSDSLEWGMSAVRCCVRCAEGTAHCGPREKGHRHMRYGDSRASALWGRGDGRWRRIVCVTPSRRSAHRRACWAISAGSRTGPGNPLSFGRRRRLRAASVVRLTDGRTMGACRSSSRPRAFARVLHRSRRTARRRRRAFGGAARLGLGRPRVRHRPIDRPRVGTADARVRRSGRCPTRTRGDRRCLPNEFRGWPTRYGWDDVPVSSHVNVRPLGEWLERQLGYDARRGLTTVQWLTTPQQLLSEIAAGEVFSDGTGELVPLRAVLEWYPDDVWRWLVGCQWWRIDQEEPLVGRAAEVGDELGSRVVPSRLARDAMRLGFLLERRYAPYTKWLGSAFAQLECATEVGPALSACLPRTSSLCASPRGSRRSRRSHAGTTRWA